MGRVQLIFALPHLTEGLAHSRSTVGNYLLNECAAKESRFVRNAEKHLVRYKASSLRILCVSWATARRL